MEETTFADYDYVIVSFSKKITFLLMKKAIFDAEIDYFETDDI